MKRFLHNFFIPHANNGYRPHSLRKETLSLVAAFIIIVEIAFLASALVFRNTDFLAAVLPGALVSFANEERSALALPTLTTNPILEQAAKLKANDMAAKSYFAHTSPEGVTPWYWLERVGYQYLFAGENLAVNFFESRDVSVAWMNSPTHRANIVNEGYTEIGIATSEGMYKGQATTFVVQFFGRPRLPVVRENIIKTAEASSVVSPVPAKVSKVSSQATAVQTVPPQATPEETLPAPVVVAPNPTPNVAGEALNSPTPSENGFVNSLTRFFQKLATSPRSIASTIQITTLALLMIALILAVVIHIRIQQPRALAGALLVMLLTGGFLFANTKIFPSDTELPADISMSATVYRAF